MKKNIITAGVLAAGVAGLYAENVTGLNEIQRSKPWNVSGSVRGFYDSNPELQHNNPESSWGVSIIPSFSYNMPLENSLITADLIYTASWYENRPNDNWDQQVQFDVGFNHKFSESSMLNVADSFVYSDQPDVIDQGGPVTSPLILRTDNSGIRNRLPIDYTTKFSERFGIGAGYQNTYYNYSQNGDYSYSALLDRVEQLLHIDVDYYLRENLVALAGYQFGVTDYLSNDLIQPGSTVEGKDRSTRSHYFYVGAQNAFSTQLKAALKIGAVYTDWYDLNQNDWTPYMDGSVTYTYLPGSYLRGGVLITHNATDVATPSTSNSNDVTLDQQSATLYVAVNHAVTARLSLNLLGQIQFSEYQGGAYDGDVDDYWIFGASVNYKVTKNLFTEAGYNWDNLQSDIPGRSFVRNRAFVGMGVTF